MDSPEPTDDRVPTGDPVPKPSDCVAGATGVKKMSSFRGWLTLFRPPNLFTVPGDPLAGFVLMLAAGGPNAAWQVQTIVLAVLASLLLYSAGLLQNDLFDLREDRRERPNRPLPCGAVSPLAVGIVAALLALAGVAAGFAIGKRVGFVAIAICASMTAYNAALKRVKVIGPVVMGLCRALSLLLGAAAAYVGLGEMNPAIAPVAARAVEVSFIGVMLYIAMVTLIAAGETRQRRIGLLRSGPFVVVFLWFVVVRFTIPRPDPADWGWHEMVTLCNCSEAMIIPSLVLFVAAILHVQGGSSALAGSPAPVVVQKTIGRFIRSLILVQAALVASAGAIGAPPLLCALAAGGLIIAFALSRLVGQWFYGS